MSKPKCLTTIEHTIDGIPCLIGVTYFKQVKPWKGSAESCPSDLDFYGYTESDFILLDRKGYKADYFLRLILNFRGDIFCVSKNGLIFSILVKKLLNLYFNIYWVLLLFLWSLLRLFPHTYCGGRHSLYFWFTGNFNI